MQSQYLLWGCYAVIFNGRGEVLVRQKQEGKRQWGLPGGMVNPGHYSAANSLLCSLDQELGLQLKRILGRMGSPLPCFSGKREGRFHIAEAFCCEVTGEPHMTSGVRHWNWLDVHGVRHAVVENLIYDIWPDPSLEMPRKNRMARMLLDAVSISETPEEIYDTDGLELLLDFEFKLPICDEFQISHDGLHLVKVAQDTTTVWRRLDPLTISGYMGIG